MIDVLLLAEQDTSWNRKASTRRERKGPCPDPNCSRRRDGFSVKQGDNGQWVFMCRGCWDPGDMLPEKGRKRGWGDEIDYLRHFHGMTYQQARALLDEGDASDQPDRQAVRMKDTDDWQSETWRQVAYKRMQECAAALWDTYDASALAACSYIRDRGFTDEILKSVCIGYSEARGVPRLLVPDVDEHGRVLAVHRRDLRPDCPREDRWMLAKGSHPHSLYMAVSLKRKMPTVLVESPLDALSIAQECADLVNVVATGSTTRGKTVENLARLALQPLVLVAFDADKDGDEKAIWWLKRLPGSQRLRPFLKDVNDMLADGWDIRAWVEQALQRYAPVQEVLEEIPADVLAAMDEQPLCMLCDEPGWYEGLYEGEEVMYCEEHHPGQAISLDYAERLIEEAKKKAPGLNLKIAGIFHSSQEEAYKQHRLRELAVTMPDVPTRYELDPDAVLTQDEQEALRSIAPGSYRPYVSRQRCACGCRIRYTSISGDVCAACEPGALWSTNALRLLKTGKARLARR